MKFKILIPLVMLSGCGIDNIIYGDSITRAIELCVPNGGISKITHMSIDDQGERGYLFHNFVAICKNGATFDRTLKIKAGD